MSYLYSVILFHNTNKFDFLNVLVMTDLEWDVISIIAGLSYLLGWMIYRIRQKTSATPWDSSVPLTRTLYKIREVCAVTASFLLIIFGIVEICNK
jgi:hypothetical protein